MESGTVLKLNTGLILARLSRGEKPLVRDVSLSVGAGESLALIGETGSGKTMTALSLMGLLPGNVRQTGERAEFLGRPLPEGSALRRLLGTKIVYIPQNGAECLNPSRTVARQLGDGLKKNRVPAGRRHARAMELLRAVGFGDPEGIGRMYPFELSGGMAQRVTIARAACADARLVLADEPTNGLDRAATEGFFALLDRLFPDAGRLVITHDISVARLCDRVAVLSGGRMCETGPAGEVLADPKHPYTGALLGALVENGMQETPVLRESAGACPFYARCPRAAGICEDGSGGPPHQRQGDREWWCFDP